MANKHQAMYDYILQNETIQKFFFLTNEVQNNSITMTPVYSDEVVKRYIDGTAERQYDFAVALYKSLSDVPYDTENLLSMTEAQSFMVGLTRRTRRKITRFRRELHCYENSQFAGYARRGGRRREAY